MRNISKVILSHNGIDIDQFILLTIYPTAVFFTIGLIAKKGMLSEFLKYTIQAITCIIFSIVYFVGVAHGGANGLAIVLAMFGVLLLFMARKQKIQPAPSEDKARAA
jgi:hypothetical protein